MSFKSQTLINTVGNTVYLVALWLLTVLTTQLLGYKDVGNLTLAITLGNFFAIIQGYGVRTFQSSDMSFQYTPRVYLISRLITCTAGLVLGVVACAMLGYLASVQMTAFLFILLKTSETFSDVLFGDDQRFGHLEYAGYSMLLRGILIVLFFYIGASCTHNLNTALISAGSSAWFLSLLMDFPLYKKTVKYITLPFFRETINLLRECFPLFISALLPMAVTAIPRIVLEHFLGPEPLGFYGNVSAPALFLTAVTPSVLAAFLPRYGSMFNKGDFRGIIKLLGLSIILCLILGMICLIGTYILGRWIMTIVYTDLILPYLHYLYPIIITMIVYSFDMCFATALIAMRESRKLFYAALIAFVMNLILAWPLIRCYGISGAILALAIPYAVQTAIQAIWIIKICTSYEKEKNDNIPT